MSRPSHPRSTRPTLMAVVAVIILCLPMLPGGLATAAPEPTEGWPTAEGWPVYGGSLAHTGTSPAAGPSKKDDATSPYRMMARSFGAPVIDASGFVYVGDTAGKVYKLTPSLEKVWASEPLGGPLRSSVLVGPNGTVYAAPVHQNVFALDGDDGKVLWTAKVGNTAPADAYVVTGAPIWHPDGLLVVPSMDGNVYAFDEDGKRQWSAGTHTDFDNKVVASPAVRDDGRIYFGSQNGRMYAVGADGKRAWSIETRALTGIGCPEEQQVAAPALGPDGTIYVGTRLKRCGNVGMVYAITDKGGSASIKWTHQMGDKVTAPVTVDAAGNLFVGALDGSFERLKPSDGTTVWSFDPRQDDPTLRDEIMFSITQPIAFSVAEQAVADAAGRVYVSYWHIDFGKGFPPQESLRSPFYALDADDGDVVWRRVFDKTMRSPALAPTEHMDGATRHAILYVAGDDGRTYGLGTVAPDVHAMVPPEVPDGGTEPDQDAGHGNGAGATEDAAESPLPVHTLLLLLVALTACAGRLRPGRKP